MEISSYEQYGQILNMFPGKKNKLFLPEGSNDELMSCPKETASNVGNYYLQETSPR